jgi:signal transduction histidine kinase
MKLIKLLTLLLLNLIVSNSLLSSGNEPQPVRGVLDLTGASINEKFRISLNGEWEFYWKKLYRPYHFTDGKAPKPDGYIRVPSYWTDADLPEIAMEGEGYATYRLRIVLPQGINPPLGLLVKVFDSSYDLYIDGNFMGSNGVPGISEESTVPAYDPTIYRFTTHSDTLEVLFNVSNYHHRRGGFWLPVEFGSFSQIQSVASINYGRSISTVSILTAFTLFFFFFFILYREDRASLFFAITLLGMSLRPLFTNQYLIYTLADPSWEWTVRFEYMSLYIMLTGAFLFLNGIYKSHYHRFFANISTVIFIALAAATVILPVKIFSWFTFPAYMFVVMFAINSLSGSITRFIKNRQLLDAIYFGGFLLIVSAAIHDIILAMVSVSGHRGYILSEAIIIFVFIQTGLLIYQWVNSFREKERLKNNLEQLNRDLESMIHSRTRELTRAKNKAVEYSKKIEEQNKNLTDTIQLKNKIFSVIAHDLRSPVVNIQYILNLLKEEEYRDKYESLAGSCINYSQMVINLLENMLVWGRGQEDHIRYAPELHDLAGIILTNMSIYKDNADRKNIAVNFTQIGGTRAWVDRELIDIIIRNILSNAIKYTRRGGRISILLKEKPKPESEILIKICDNGIGIPLEKQEQLFSPGDIESTPGTENEKGTGFGLKLVGELVKVNKGKIELESKPGEGTCFTITLPAKKKESE